MVKKPPAMQETPVLSLVQEDPLENGMATHSRILAWRIQWMQSTGLKRVSRTEWLTPSLHFSETHPLPVHQCRWLGCWVTYTTNRGVWFISCASTHGNWDPWGSGDAQAFSSSQAGLEPSEGLPALPRLPIPWSRGQRARVSLSLFP